jgi:hypothetical protein
MATARQTQKPPAIANRTNSSQSSSGAACHAKSSRATISAEPAAIVAAISRRTGAALDVSER